MNCTKSLFLKNSRAGQEKAAPRHARWLCLVTLLLSAWSGVLFAESGDRATRVVFLGDSLTAGYGVGLDEAFPAILEERMRSEGIHAVAVNAGLSGETSAGGLQRADWVLRQPVDVLVLALGANDGLRGLPPEETSKNLRAIIEKTRERHPDVRILLAGMLAPPNMGAAYRAEFDAVYPEVAQTSGVALMPFLLEDVAGEPELNQADGIHPTAEGHRRMAGNIWPHLRPLLLPNAPSTATPASTGTGDMRDEQERG